MAQRNELEWQEEEIDMNFLVFLKCSMEMISAGSRCAYSDQSNALHDDGQT